MNGYFCVSLDMELFWGVHDTANLEYRENVKCAREKAIPAMLELLKKYDIHSTWAIVGAAFASSLDELKKYIPDKELQPTYNNKIRSPYHLFDENVIDEDGDKPSAFLAGSDIRKIAEVANQEIATHTFSHYYCNEAGQTPEQFEADLKSACAIAKDKGYELKSIVYPKNEINFDCLKITKKYGIEAYRGIEDNWIYRSKLPMIVQRIIRFADAYFPLSGPNCHLPKQNGELLNLCASRIFKPYNKKLSVLEPLKIRRIKSQMKYAAKNGRIFHMWWHPHNFGTYTEKNIENLEKILIYYEKLNVKYGMQSKNMSELTTLYKEK